MRTITTTSIAVATSALLLSSCTSCERPAAEGERDEAAPAVEPSVDPSGGMSVLPKEDAAVVQALAPVKTLADFAPVMREVAEGGGAVNRIVVELARPAMKRAGPALKGTRLVIEPEVEGSLVFSTPTTLEYRLPAGKTLANDKLYTVTLAAIEIEGGAVVAAEGGQVFQHQIRTPPFRLERVGFQRLDLAKKRVELDVVFSGPVKAGAVRSALQAWVRDERARVTVADTPSPSVVRAVVESGRIDEGVAVRLHVSGLQSANGDELRGDASRSVTVPTGPEVRVFSAHVVEAGDGYAIHVVCSDEAKKKRTADDDGEELDYFWDEHNHQSYRVSQRCELTPAAAREHVHLTPDPGQLTVSAARGGFQIHAEVKRGTYELRIDGGAESVDGGVVKRGYEMTLSVPARSPRVDFVAQGRYLPRDAWNRLALRHLNVDEANLEVRHVRPENLVFWMSNYSEQTDHRTAEVIARRKLAFRGEPDTPATAWLELATMLPQATKGMLEIAVSAKGARGDARRLVLTDMNLVAKQGQDEVMVWAFGIHDNKPLAGVDVKLVTSSGLEIGRCSTGADGGCRISPQDKDKDLPRARYALIATKGDDLTYLKFADLMTPIADADVQGTKFSDKEAPYRAALYSDRGVYRPGETAHVVAVVRDGNGALPKAGMPVELLLLDPKQKAVKRRVLELSSVGLVSEDLKFSDFAETGRYTVTLLAGKKTLGSYGFNVEEFVPERMKVDVAVKPAALHASEPVPVDVSARYLFGGSARGSQVELACDLMPSTFKPKSLKEYEFGVWYPENKTPRPLAVGKVAGELDDDGQASLECPAVEKGAGFAGPAKVIARASVFEAGSGRSTVNETTVPLHPERFYLGLKSSKESVGQGDAFRVDGVVVNWDGEPVVRDVPSIKVALYRVTYEYGWSYDEWDGSWESRYHQRAVLESEHDVNAKDGRFAVELKAQQGASLYLVRATAGDSRTDLALESRGYYYWWSYGWDEGGGNEQTPKPAKPATIDLTLPAKVKVGEKVTVKAKAPYPGRMLLTVETDRILHHTWQDVQAGDVEHSFNLSSFTPNVYVSAFLMKDPHLDSKQAFTPERAFGVGNVMVEPTEFRHDVALEVPSEVRSSSALEVKLDVGAVAGKAFATVAAVDEGILQLTKFASPEPLASIFEKRGLGVSTFETIGWNLLLPAGDAASSHGGDEGSGPGRVQPVKPVALWSGVVEVPASGKLSVTLDVPQYRGSLRVMAVVVSEQRIGSASKNVLVRDPIVLQTTLPRFLVSGDRFDVPVFLTNLSGKDADVEVTLRTEQVDVPGLTLTQGMERKSPIALAGEPRKTLRLKNDESGRVVFSATAEQPFGAARFRVQAKAGTTVVHEELVVPFAPAGAKTREVQRIKLESATTDVLPYLEGYLPMSERSTLWVTTTPWGDVFDHMKHLIRYPYGCIEQTTSSTRPLLYVGKLVSKVDPEIVADGGIEKRVMFGVERLLSMQTPSGGFGYWPGDTEPNYWGTAYVVHLLLDAVEQKYPVPKSRIDDAVAWIEKELTYMIERAGGASTGYSWDHGHRYAEPYFHYVLARAGKARKARMEKLLGELAKEPETTQRNEQLYLLKAALWLAGDRRYERDLKALDVSPVEHKRNNDWSYYSDTRRRGLMLSIFGDLFGADPAGAKLADIVADTLRSRSSWWWSTQEIAWGMTGLGKRLDSVGAGISEAPVLVANGNKPAAATVPNDDKRSNERTWNLYRASEHEELKVTISDKDKGKLWLILSSEGVKKDAPIKTGGDGLKLERSYYSPDGNTASLSSLALGELVYVAVTLHNTSGRRVQNIALVDRLPAGFEIENPRLGRGGAIDLVDESELWSVDHMNVRDDRLEVFGALGTGEKKTIVYAARAVTAGTFTLPPVEAEAMYDPTLWARATGPKVTVQGPWEE